ncbi:MAG TPA: cadherin-like domain-containing protein, partial [Pseudohaliea sp.]|nr:cadherin-like domain-containing protein [Pseudohaliea sp.]
DTGVTFNVLLNDTDLEDDPLSISGLDTSTLQGSLTSNGDGSFTYDPDGQFEDLDDGETAQDVFTYTVTDGTDTDSAQVTITITGISDTPPNLQVDVQPWDNPVLNGSLEGDDNLGTSLGEGLGEAFVFEGSGNAQIAGTGLGDEITGGPDNDRLSGGNGDDIINGEAGIDRLAGGNGNDVLNGGENNDVLYGNNGNDQLVGGPGADLLDGGAGNDILTGNEGADLFIYDGRGDDVITDFMVGEDELQLPVGAEPEVEVTDAGTVLTFDDPLGSLTLAGVIVDLDML